MKSNKPCILTINGGSSSIKFALYELSFELPGVFHGEIEGIGTQHAKLNYSAENVSKPNEEAIQANDYEAVAAVLMTFLDTLVDFGFVKGIGHRIVHGMDHSEPELITDALLEELKTTSAYDPEHMPGEIRLIELFRNRYNDVKQVACFDTSFHADMPDVAKWLAIPRKYREKGVRRYGFHGLSYGYLMEEIERLAGKEAAQGRVILAHLGNGASLAAVNKGKCIDTSMGFTPSSGLPMSTRCGDLDPGVAWYFMEIEKFNAKQFNDLINHQSGLLGISETSSDMRKLLKIQHEDIRASDAIEFFCYQTKKWIGSFTTVLNGIDTVVFSGGIGQHSPEVRSKIVAGLSFLGIELDELKNMNNEPIISSTKSSVTVHVIRTNEEVMIAKLVSSLLGKSVNDVNL